MERLDKNAKFRVEPYDYFESLEKAYNDGITESTSERNAISYSVVHQNKLGKDIQQFSIYDIAGEVFVDENFDGQQEQFAYCDGFIFIIDPLAVKEVRQENEIDDPLLYSMDNVDSVICGFCNAFSALRGLKTTAKSKVPISVVITKADIKSVKKQLSRPKIQTLANSEYRGDTNKARDTVCREYLFDIGLQNAVNNLEAKFTDVHYFPVSSIGQNPELGNEPYGVFEAVEWIIYNKCKVLRDILAIKQEV
jgi:hypothetical protein